MIPSPSMPRLNRLVGLWVSRPAMLCVLSLTIISGCSALSLRDWSDGSTGNPLIPTRYQTEVGAFRVSSNEPMAADDPALLALVGLEARLDRVLGVRVPEGEPPIEIYILDDEHAFTTFLTFHHPELPNRRAFFLAVGDIAAVYTARGTHLEEDLRHEATHAVLHRAVGNVPLWLDEGLAEYFEIEPHALTAEAIDRFRRLAESYREGWRPNLRRLEEIENVAIMSPTDYREAWAWTSLLLHSPRRGDLVTHLDQLRISGDATLSISERLQQEMPQLNRQFLARVAPRISGDSQSLTRLQSPPPTLSGSSVTVRPQIVLPREPQRVIAVAPEPPRGPIGRLRAGIGSFFDRVIP